MLTKHSELTLNAMPPRTVLSVKDLRVVAPNGVEIISDINFEMRQGELLALVGESGSGKTTLAHSLLFHSRRAARIASGEISVSGVSLLGLSRSGLRAIRGAQISYVPQDPASWLNPRHRIGAQIIEAMTAHRKHVGDQHAVLARLLLEVGLPADRSFADRYPFQLSGGQQQRVAIAIALACEPAVVVLDEPTTGLDPTTQIRIMHLLSSLATRLRTAFLLVTHDLGLVRSFADRVMVMYAGRVVESGDVETIFRRPVHPYTQLLLHSVPGLGEDDCLTGIPGSAPSIGDRPEGCAFSTRCPGVVDRCEVLPPLVRFSHNSEVRCWRADEAYTVPLPNQRQVSAKASSTDIVLTANALHASHRTGNQRVAVLKDVSLRLHEGETLAVVGESGSGKTTLGRCLSGLHQLDSGEVDLRNVRLSKEAVRRTLEQRRQIQIVFQNPHKSLNPAETVGQAISRPLRLYGNLSSVAVHSDVHRLLDQVRLPGSLIDAYPGDLSGGEKQRVAIARTLAARPSVLICDEITASLDVSLQAEFVNLLKELREDGLSMIFITHDLSLVKRIADRVLVLQRGVVQETGTTDQIVNNPSTEYGRELVASAAHWDVTIAGGV